MKNQILLYEPNIRYLPSLAFLFSVGDLAGTHARSTAEAMNWLEAVRLRVIAFDLVLISSWVGAAAENELVENVLELPLPIVFLQRDGGPPMADMHTDNLLVCDLDNLLSCLNDCLTLTQGESYARRANHSC